MTTTKKQRSPAEKWIVRTFLLVGVGLILFEARAKYGYDLTMKYLRSATEQEEASTAIAAAVENGDEEKGFVDAVDDVKAQTWGSLQSKAFGPLAFMAPIMRGSVGEVVKSAPVIPKNEDGEEVKLKDKDGNEVEMQAERSYEKSLRWFSLRDLASPKPVYQLHIKLAGDGDAAEVVTYRSSQMDESDLWANPDRMKANKFIPASEASKYLGGGPGGGGQPRRRRNRGNDEDKGSSRPGRPSADGGADDESAGDSDDAAAKGDEGEESAATDDAEAKGEDATADDGDNKEAETEEKKEDQ